MVKKAGAALFFSLFAFYSFAADIVYRIEPRGAEFVLNFIKGYSALDVLKSENAVVLSFETAEKLDFKPEEFFDLPITSASLMGDSFRKKFVVTFEKGVIEPVITKDAKKVTAFFPFPAGVVPADNATALPTPVKAPAAPAAGAYFKMIFGLGAVLLLILILYRFVKSYFKKQVFTDIPGSGRLLGKVDLDIRKSLFFYEIGDTVYIIGLTDSGMTLIDKIIDEAEATKIRAGFTKKKEFAGYMSFFKRKEGLDDEISAGNALVEEKLKSLRKK